jgi:hypothetical protein
MKRDTQPKTGEQGPRPKSLLRRIGNKITSFIDGPVDPALIRAQELHDAGYTRTTYLSAEPGGEQTQAFLKGPDKP